MKKKYKYILSILSILVILVISILSYSPIDISNKLNKEVVLKRLEITKKYLSLYKTNDNQTGTINIKGNDEKLYINGFDCENVIPLLEYQINKYNYEIGTIITKRNSHYFNGLRNILISINRDYFLTSMEGLYDNQFSEFNGFVKLEDGGKDQDGICLYNSYLLNKEGKTISTSHGGRSPAAIYTNGQFVYQELFGLDSKIVNKLKTVMRFGGRVSSIGNYNFEDTTFYSEDINKSLISEYLNYLNEINSYYGLGTGNYSIEEDSIIHNIY